MIKVIILGAGNLAFHLTNKFLKNTNINLVQVYNRNIDKIKHIESKTLITNNLNNIKEADIYIISISDNAISELSSKLLIKDKLVVHTSGAAHLNELKCNSNKGVFYPLQSFSKDKEIDFSKIPICLEATTESDYKLLNQLASFISNKCFEINSVQRNTLHVAAVFVNNFVNHLYHVGSEICTENNIPFEILQPLIEETSNKIKNLSAFESQTGPAIRNDSKTIQKHLTSLNEDQQKIYSILTNSILKTHGKKL